MSVSFLQREGLPAMAYRYDGGRNAQLPTVVFLHGLRSDMDGTKAAYLADVCAKRGQNFLRFDVSGHGQSEGDFINGTIGTWLRDSLDMVDRITKGPLVLVGSSMGGWLALLLGLERPERVRGLIGLAAAPDFTRDIITHMNAAQKKALEEKGWFDLHDNPEFPIPITQALLDDGERYCLLDKPIEISCPLRLIQGMKDADVTWQTAHRIANALTGADKQVYLRESGDHRLSSPEDLELLSKTVRELSNA